jgi:hypothetical protein
LPRTEASSGGTSTSARSPSAGRSAEIGGRGSEESGSGTKGKRENDGEAEKQLESHQETQTRTGRVNFYLYNNFLQSLFYFISFGLKSDLV